MHPNHQLRWRDRALVDRVLLAHVSPVGVTPTGQWTCDQMKEFAPLQSLDVALSAKGQPALEISYSVDGILLIGQFFAAEPTTARRPILLPWMVDRIGKYVPISESPYTAIHLCWCMAMKGIIAA